MTVNGESPRKFTIATRIKGMFFKVVGYKGNILKNQLYSYILIINN